MWGRSSSGGWLTIGEGTRIVDSPVNLWEQRIEGLAVWGEGLESSKANFRGAGKKAGHTSPGRIGE